MSTVVRLPTAQHHPCQLHSISFLSQHRPIVVQWHWTITSTCNTAATGATALVKSGSIQRLTSTFVLPLRSTTITPAKEHSALDPYRSRTVAETNKRTNGTGLVGAVRHAMPCH